jgi:hypothetical protein
MAGVVNFANADYRPTTSRFGERAKRTPIVRPVSELLEDLAHESRRAEASVAAARSDTSQQLEERRAALKTQLDTTKAEQRAAADQTRTAADSKWSHLQSSLKESIDTTEAELDAAKADWNTQKAAARAEQAEAQANDAVGFAREAIATAEYLALYSMQCRAEADALAVGR